MPPHRAYLVFAGLEQAIGDLLTLAFSPEQIDAIRRWPVFAASTPPFFGKLALAAVRGRRLGRCPRGRSSSRARRCCE